MGKKSLTKSTSKKKTTKKKSTAKTTSKKAVSADAKTKKTTAKKPTAKKKPTLKALRKKDFGAWAPETLFTAEPETGQFSAPPAIDSDDKKRTESLKALLAKQFDLSEKKKPAPKKAQKKKEPATAKAKKETPKKEQKKAAPKKKAVSVDELIKKQFDAWQPDKLFEPAGDQEPAAQFSAPPFSDDMDSEKLKELLFREFDLSKVTPKPPPEPEAPAPAEEAAATEAPAEPETAEPEPEVTEPAEEAVETEEPAEPEAVKTEEKKEEKPAAEIPKAEPPKAEKPAKTAKPSAKPEPPKKPSPPPSGGSGGGEPPATPPPSGPQEPKEPVSNALKITVICIAALFACLILASALNSNKYYIKASDEGTEIWKGDFSPRGKEVVIFLNDLEPPETIPSGAVSKQKAYELPFKYFMTRAEKLSEKPGIPDFAAIREELKKARKYAITHSQIQQINNRLNHIEFLFLLYKADMAADQKTADGYDKALNYLEEARELAVTGAQANSVDKRIQEIKNVQPIPEKQKPANQSKTPSGKPEQDQAKEKPSGAEKSKSTDSLKVTDSPAKSQAKPEKQGDEEHIM
mgnify:CR=1 FL=1